MMLYCTAKTVESDIERRQSAPERASRLPLVQMHKRTQFKPLLGPSTEQIEISRYKSWTTPIWKKYYGELKSPGNIGRMSRRTTDKTASQKPPNATRPSTHRGASGAWSRFRPATIDPLDVYGLPSKGETGLHDFKAQEAYHKKVVERYMKFCASSGGGEGLEKAFAALSTSAEESRVAEAAAATATVVSKRPALPRHVSTTERPNDMPNILLAMRKLREGILASRRRDHFAQRAYMFIIHASILTRSWESYQPALNYLLRVIHPESPLSTPELQEFVGYQILDLACRQYELLDAFTKKLAYKHRDRRVNAVLMSLVQDDWVRFWRNQRAVDGYQRAIMEFAVERMRLHALKCLGRSYMSADHAFVERSADAPWDELVKSGVGWDLQENGMVLIRKPKAK
nr:hypothetical protein CFP56_63033 [Quercus suber]